MTLMSVRGLAVDLPGSGRVIDDVSLEASHGEVVAVVGESGAGKSVLARTLLGLTQADPSARVTADELTFDGRDLRSARPRRWRRLRGSDIGLVLQDALQSLDPLRTVAAEVGETPAIHGIRRRERRSQVLDALRRAGLPEAETLLARRSGELSGGMRQRVLIASAIVGGARLLIADEPTTALDATVAVRVLDLLRGLADDGAGVLFITHDLLAARRIADRVLVLDAGRAVETGPTRSVLTAPSHPVTHALLAALPTEAERRPVPSPTPATGVGIEAREVSRRYGRVAAVDGVSVSVEAGRTLGVVGESGSGKSTLGRLLIGQEQPDAGSVERRGAPRVRLIPQDPLGSFDPRRTVGRILRDARAQQAPEPGDLLARVGLEAGLLDRLPARLSGGQRQRVAIARALAAQPNVLVCDEPVSALDVTTQAGILDLLRDLQQRDGLAMVFISHDLAVVRGMADRVAVMRDGRIVEEGATDQVYADPQHPFTRELIAAAG